MSRAVIVPADFDPAPSLGPAAAGRVSVADAVPAGTDVIGVPLGTGGEPREMLALSRAGRPGTDVPRPAPRNRPGSCRSNAGAGANSTPMSPT